MLNDDWYSYSNGWVGKDMRENTFRVWEQIVLVRFINQTEKNHVNSQSRGLAWLSW